LLYAVSMIVGLFTAFILTVLWKWFVVPAFHVTAVSFWVMYGLTLSISLFQLNGNDLEAEHRHKIVAAMLDSCVPADRREEVKEQLTEFADEIWYKAGWKLFGKVLSNTFTLGLAFVVHVLAS
jgi:hypothetical protein